MIMVYNLLIGVIDVKKDKMLNEFGYIFIYSCIGKDKVKLRRS